MTILNLVFIVFLGILFFIAYFHISNYILDTYGNKTLKRYNFENSIRVIVFIAPAFIVLFIFILYPVFETIRLSFFDKYGREFVGIYNYLWEGENLSSGIYFITLQAEVNNIQPVVFSRKMIYLK